MRAPTGRSHRSAFGLRSLTDSAGATIIDASGFGPAWQALVDDGLRNSRFDLGTPGTDGTLPHWTFGTTPLRKRVISRPSGGGQGSGLYVAQWDCTSTTGDGTGTLTSSATRVLAGKRYLVEMSTRLEGCTYSWWTVSVTLRWLTYSGTQIGSDVTSLCLRAKSTGYDADPVASRSIVTAPADAASVIVEAVVTGDYRSFIANSPTASLYHLTLIDLPDGEAWVAPTFTNSWVDYGSPFQAARYRKRADNVVELQGLIKSGTLGSSAFTLPAGYRPGGLVIVPVTTNTTSGTGRCDVNSSGHVIPHSTFASNSWLSLSGISFLAEA